MSSLDFLDAREQFIPFTTSTILDRVLGDPRFSKEESEQFDLLFQMVSSRFHFEFLHEIEELKKCYEPFDPDPDTWFRAKLTAEEVEQYRQTLCAGIRKLLKDGNYVALTKEQLEQCLELQTHGGLAIKVKLDDYPELEVYYRGVRDETRHRRSWWTLFKKVPYQVRVLKRAAVLVTSVEKSDEQTNGRHLVSGASIHERVVLKLFKDVVIDDLKMMLPSPRPVMRLFDKIKVASTVAGGLFPPILKVLFMAALSPMLLLVVMGGCVGALVKGVISFLARKTKYMQTLSSCLYFQNLANNTSALTRLVDAAEAQESKELLLAYFLLYVERDHDYTMDELDERVEQWLLDQFGQDIDFEVDDAVRKLVEKDLMVEREVPPPAAAQGPGTGDGSGPQEPPPTRSILKVYDLPTSLRRLDEWWDDYFPFSNEGDAANDRLAEGAWPPFSREGVLPGPHAPHASPAKSEATHGG